jgi:NAD(P)-dependent dehydrogenase (short-subunit alcohol dehydrogenase family)
MQGADAYATSKQCILAAAMAFAREIPGLHVNAVNPGTGLGRDANVFLRAIASALTLLAPFIKYWGTPKSAAGAITKAVLNEAGETGVYYDEDGHPMLASALVRDMAFQDRVVAETRPLLSER